VTEEERETRGWLSDALGRRRRAALEETLFRQLEELEQGPLERLGALVNLVIGELRAAQRRLTEQAVDLGALREAVSILAGRVEQLEGRPASDPAAGHVLLLTTADGYRLVEREDAAPRPGKPLVHDGRAYRVLRPGPSPLPGDRRPCLLALPDRE
jgi:hypothetical protein